MVLVPFMTTEEPERRIRVNPAHVRALDTADAEETEIHLGVGIAYIVRGSLDAVAARLIEAAERGY